MKRPNGRGGSVPGIGLNYEGYRDRSGTVFRSTTNYIKGITCENDSDYCGRSSHHTFNGFDGFRKRQQRAEFGEYCNSILPGKRTGLLYESFQHSSRTVCERSTVCGRRDLGRPGPGPSIRQKPSGKNCVGCQRRQREVSISRNYCGGEEPRGRLGRLFMAASRNERGGAEAMLCQENSIPRHLGGCRVLRQVR